MPGQQCDGCLGSQRCWVCLGLGVIDQPRGTPRPCHRCFGTGKCSLCQQLMLSDLGHPPELTP